MGPSVRPRAEDNVAPVGAPQMAASLGVVDALVLRRIGSGRWAHIGGLGQGSSWAGIIDIDTADDPLAFRIPPQVGEVARAQFAEPERMLGPYYAAAGATVRVSTDVAVVLGNPHESLGDIHDVELLRLAQLIDSEVDEVQPSKRLADELEVLMAVRELMDAPLECGLPETLHHMLDTATNALTCEVGVLRTQSGVLQVIGGGRVPDGTWREVLDELDSQMGEELWCAQDMSRTPSPLLTKVLPEARAMLTTALPTPMGGRLLFIHTSNNPRGFTTQCRRICTALVDTGSIVARTAMLRDNLRVAADQASAAARTDPLTGLGNRLAWDEAIAQAQENVDHGSTYSVVSVDVDGLKGINDRYGHNEGDNLLRRCAEVIREHCSVDDLAVRIGGDEFSILVPHGLTDGDRTYLDFAQSLGGMESTRTSVAASIGVCTVQPGESLFDAVRDADMRMYGNKQRRRRQRRREASLSESG